MPSAFAALRAGGFRRAGEWVEGDAIRFVHTGDIHLDSPLRGLSGQAGTAAECIRTAKRGVEHPHDTPPYSFMPSPTSAHNSQPSHDKPMKKCVKIGIRSVFKCKDIADVLVSSGFNTPKLVLELLENEFSVSPQA